MIRSLDRASRHFFPLGQMDGDWAKAKLPREAGESSETRGGRLYPI
jgi:hypothetical protein